AASVTSRGSGVTRPSGWAKGWRVPAYTRVAPLRSASSTSARPMPRLPPVIRTVLSAIVTMVTVSFSSRLIVSAGHDGVAWPGQVPRTGAVPTGADEQAAGTAFRGRVLRGEAMSRYRCGRQPKVYLPGGIFAAGGAVPGADGIGARGSGPVAGPGRRPRCGWPRPAWPECG